MVALRISSIYPRAWLRRRYARGRLATFFRWWRNELRRLVPVRLRVRWFPGSSCMYCELAGDELRITTLDMQGERELHRWPLDEAETHIPAMVAEWASSAAAPACWLLLQQNQVLRPRISLPVAAEERLRDVVAFEIDRQTPFSAEQVVFDQRVLDRRESEGKLIVEAVVLPKATLDSVLDSVPIPGLAGIDVRVTNGSRLGVNLLPVERRSHRRHPATLLNFVLLTIVILGTAFTLGRSLDNREQAVESLRVHVIKLRAEADEVTAMRKQLTIAGERANFLGDKLAARPAVVEVLATLTDRLPDGTWLEKLTIDEGHLSLVVYSDQATALVKKLQEAPFLRGLALSGAIQADEHSGRDHFTLVSELIARVPEVAPKADKNSRPEAPTGVVSGIVDASSL